MDYKEELRSSLEKKYL